MSSSINSASKRYSSQRYKTLEYYDVRGNYYVTQKQCKLGDFGWATICDQRRTTYCGTTDYVSPEIVGGQEYGEGVDMWCIGVFAF